MLVLVDEAHRSHTSTLHANLMAALPNCAKIGFTGTPIVQEHKTRTHEIFGPFIDVYTIKQSQEDGATVQVTRIGDLFIGLAPRAAIANAGRPDVFVSIHHNSTGNPVTNGTETYYTHANSRGLAESLNFFMVKNMDTANRGVKQRGLAVTRLTRVPAVLTEASFITSSAESSAFINLDRVEQESMGLQQGLLNYFAHR